MSRPGSWGQDSSRYAIAARATLTSEPSIRQVMMPSTHSKAIDMMIRRHRADANSTEQVHTENASNKMSTSKGGGIALLLGGKWTVYVNLRSEMHTLVRMAAAAPIPNGWLS